MKIPALVMLELVEPLLNESRTSVRYARESEASYLRWRGEPNWDEVWKDDYERSVRDRRKAVARRKRLAVVVAGLKREARAESKR